MSKAKDVLIGSTSRFTVEFTDAHGAFIDPNEVTFKLYSIDESLIQETLLDASNKSSTGCYFYDLVVKEPMTKDTQYIYEFKGDFGSYPSVNRGTINVIFIK